jgi:hypothetical protein
LTQFCLGKILEQAGKKAEALKAYQEFLCHFVNSTAKLPQIAEVRAAVKRLMEPVLASLHLQDLQCRMKLPP